MLTFLKLGGSLITNKDVPYSARKQTIKRVGLEIAKFWAQHPEHKILIGHGSGSFGHTSAAGFGTVNGVQTPSEWRGFQSVWWAAHQLNQIVCELLIEVGLPIISLPASSSLVAHNRSTVCWTTDPILKSIENGLIPLLFGDVIFDYEIGGTIFSTEELFSRLISTVKPDQILLAGIDAGVYQDYPKNQKLISHITPQSFDKTSMRLENSSATDVTGGMASKIVGMLEIIKENPDTKIQVFSGENDLNISKALAGERVGTIISA